MKNSRVLIVYIVGITILSVITGCTIDDSEMVQYEYFDDYNGQGTCIMVDDVLYKELNWQEWNWKADVEDEYVEIGKGIYSVDGELNADVIIYEPKPKMFEKYEPIVFIKEDINIPTFTAENIQSIGFKFPIYKSISENEYSIKHDDSDMINKIFLLTENVTQMNESYYKKAWDNKEVLNLFEITFYCTDIKGIEKNFWIYAIEDKYWIRLDGNSVYAEITQELLSEISKTNIPEAKSIYTTNNKELCDIFGLEHNE